MNGSISQASERVRRGLDSSIEAIPLCSSRYPESLRRLTDPPAVLYVRGKLDAVANPRAVAVVGTRRATVNGLEIASRISHHLSDNSWVVVSGLALGIDAAAHTGALRGPAPTVAVLAHGLEQAKPKANAQLAHQILEQGGAWVSEHWVGSGGTPDQFVARNRLQVGLAAGSVIVEGAASSGTASHARFCIRENKPLFAVLAPRLGVHGELARELVQRGATPIRSKADYDDLVTRLEVAAESIGS